MSGAKNVHKIIKKAILEMMLHDQLDVESSGFHIISFLTPVTLCPSLTSQLWVFAHLTPLNSGSLPFSCLSLTSPFPVSIDTDNLQDQQMSSNRCPHQSPINFPTWSSHDDMFWGSGFITRQ